MSPVIEKKIAENETFLHFTFVYHKDNIEKNGLNKSVDGSMGPGIYCVNKEDNEVVYRAIQNVKENINWNAVAEHIGVEDPLEIPEETTEKDYMVVVSFDYTGEYLEMTGEEFGKDVTGFVCIPNDHIPVNELIIINDINKY